ncbi:hypothetical protein ACFQDD_07230, partial [Halorubrum pallidum]
AADDRDRRGLVSVDHASAEHGRHRKDTGVTPDGTPFSLGLAVAADRAGDVLAADRAGDVLAADRAGDVRVPGHVMGVEPLVRV